MNMFDDGSTNESYGQKEERKRKQFNQKLENKIRSLSLMVDQWTHDPKKRDVIYKKLAGILTDKVSRTPSPIMVVKTKKWGVKTIDDIIKHK